MNYSILAIMIVTIAGMPGSGKGTAGKALAEELNCKFYSMGDIRGKMAMDRGITIDELNKLGENDPKTDIEVDEYQKKLGEEEDNLVIDGRTSWHFIPKSIKIFLDVDLKISAERIYNAKREDEPNYKSVEEVLNGLKLRIESDKKRYKKWYDLDCYDKNNYDFILDTTNLTIPKVVQTLLKFIRQYK